MFSLRNFQEAVRRETTEGSAIEFIGYRIPQYEQNACTILFTSISQQQVYRAFSSDHVNVCRKNFHKGLARWRLPSLLTLFENRFF